MSSKRKQNGSKDWMFEKTIKKPQNRSYEKKTKNNKKTMNIKRKTESPWKERTKRKLNEKETSNDKSRPMFHKQH